MAGARTGVAGHQTLPFQPGNMCSLYICCIIMNMQYATVVYVNDQHRFEIQKNQVQYNRVHRMWVCF
jgi:hypothetical protein